MWCLGAVDGTQWKAAWENDVGAESSGEIRLQFVGGVVGLATAEPAETAACSGDVGEARRGVDEGEY